MSAIYTLYNNSYMTSFAFVYDIALKIHLNYEACWWILEDWTIMLLSNRKII